MANNQESRTLPPSIASSLEHLANRPGVVATLILSRKDGSVIRATGILSEQPPTKDTDNENGSVVPVKDETGSSELGEDSGSNGTVKATPLEDFAAAVAGFVTSATSMNDAIRLCLSGNANRNDTFRPLTRGDSEGHNVDGEGNEIQQAVHDVSDVQLLRMRTKKHEVVIFPDSKFLSCVVQEVGKHGTNADTGAQT